MLIEADQPAEGMQIEEEADNTTKTDKYNRGSEKSKMYASKKSDQSLNSKGKKRNNSIKRVSQAIGAMQKIL